VTPAIIPDVAPRSHAAPQPQQLHAAGRNEFSAILDDVGSLFGKAQHAEDVLAGGRGDLQTAIYERARADVALAVASAAASRAAQAITSFFNMPV